MGHKWHLAIDAGISAAYPVLRGHAHLATGIARFIAIQRLVELGKQFRFDQNIGVDIDADCSPDRRITGIQRCFRDVADRVDPVEVGVAVVEEPVA